MDKYQRQYELEEWEGVALLCILQTSYLTYMRAGQPEVAETSLKLYLKLGLQHKMFDETYADGVRKKHEIDLALFNARVRQERQAGADWVKNREQNQLNQKG